MQATLRDLEMKRERAAGFVYDAGERYRRACDAVKRGRENLARIQRRGGMSPDRPPREGHRLIAQSSTTWCVIAKRASSTIGQLHTSLVVTQTMVPGENRIPARRRRRGDMGGPTASEALHDHT
jgi:hypothetical protein